MDSRIININGITYDLNSRDIISFTFLNKRNHLQRDISTIGLDLLYFGLSVCIADRKVKRSHFPDGWTRGIQMVVPVIEKEKWERNNDKIIKMLNFLSGDRWAIKWEETSLPTKTFKQSRKIINSILEEKEELNISMLSAGLDSFIGAIDLLESNQKTIFVNIYSGGNSYFKDFANIRNSLVNEYNVSDFGQFFFSFGVTPKTGGKETENSTRARSLLFFTHALALSTCFNNVKKLIIPENGTISLNVPLSMGRYGSSSTRTTHPYYMHLLSEIIHDFGLDIEIVNPYQFVTKGEMITNCKNSSFLQNNISLSMSCSHPASGRYAGRGLGHCGLCLPCLIRKAAEYKAYGTLFTKYTDMELKDLFRKTKDNQSTIRCIRYRLLSLQNSNLLVDIQKNGLLSGSLHEYVDLYKRSIEEIKNLLDRYYTEND